MINKLKIFILRILPNWLFVFLFNLFLAKQKRMNIRKWNKQKNKWIIIGWDEGDAKLISHTPKFFNVHLKDFEDSFERYFKINKGDFVLDVGPCIGDTTVFIYDKAGDTGRIIAIEPNQANAECLRYNLPHENVTIIRKGAWNKKGTLDLHVHWTPTGSSLLNSKERVSVVDSEERKTTELVEVDTIDNMINDVHINFAKIDVQSAEAEVLEGADTLLSTVDKLVVGTHYRRNPVLKTYPTVIKALKKYRFPHLKLDMDNGNVYAWR